MPGIVSHFKAKRCRKNIELTFAGYLFYQAAKKLLLFLPQNIEIGYDVVIVQTKKGPLIVLPTHSLRMVLSFLGLICQLWREGTKKK